MAGGVVEIRLLLEIEYARISSLFLMDSNSSPRESIMEAALNEI
jgi:hypothetical protein